MVDVGNGFRSDFSCVCCGMSAIGNATFAERKATLAISEHYRPHWSQAGAIEFWPKAIRTIGWGIAPVFDCPIAIFGFG
ncbi:hypothetical protein C2E31_21645 [Rhodopirellula baltica]|nr:hypothetical protein C2E31_21645 [Rhodopirellula baltica]